MLDFGNFKDVIERGKKIKIQIDKYYIFSHKKFYAKYEFIVLNIHLLWPVNLGIFLQGDKNSPLYGQWSKS